MAAPPIIWRAGDQWRSLGQELRAAGQATVITDRGTTYLADYDQGRYMRVPLEGGTVIFKDSEWLPLADMQAAACSVLVIGAFTWGLSTPVRVAATGLHPDWPVSLGPEGKAVLQAAVEKHPIPAAPGHPDVICPFPKCVAAAAHAADS